MKKHTIYGLTLKFVHFSINKIPAIKSSSPLKAFCTCLSCVLLCSHTYAASHLPTQGITENDLRQQYPDARFYCLSQKEFNDIASKYNHENMVTTSTGTTFEATMDDSGLPEYEILTTKELKYNYPTADFTTTHLDTLKINKNIFMSRRLILACNTTIPQQKGQTFASLLTDYPHERFTVF